MTERKQNCRECSMPISTQRRMGQNCPFPVDVVMVSCKGEESFCIISHVFIVIKVAKKPDFITEIWQNFSGWNCNNSN